MEVATMTYARKNLISLQDTPYYHCVARCVRRAWLWGTDDFSGKDYSHRKQWVIDRLQQLTNIFTIDICAYAVMSNHYHLVLHVDKERATNLTEQDVIARWKQLFGLPMLVEHYHKGQTTTKAEANRAKEIIHLWRGRLYDISWFMRCLNEHLARLANKEDNCKGRFWEGRYKSQALLDEAGLLTAMAYVDLNPIRASIAKTPETSVFTSVYDRIKAIKRNTKDHKQTKPIIPLHPFHVPHTKDEPALPFQLTDYLELVDWTGRAIREGKRGHIPNQLPNILTRLNIDPHAWKQAMIPHGNVFGRAMGQLDTLRLHAKTLGQSWVRGLKHSETLFGAS
jgi:REP element-mobilizing transposase RayT